MNTKVMEDQKELLNKQLESLQKDHQRLTKELNDVITNINGTLGALQYHDFLVDKVKEEEQKQIASVKSSEEITDAIEEYDTKN